MTVNLCVNENKHSHEHIKYSLGFYMDVEKRHKWQNTLKRKKNIASFSPYQRNGAQQKKMNQ